MLRFRLVKDLHPKEDKLMFDVVHYHEGKKYHLKTLSVAVVTDFDYLYEKLDKFSSTTSNSSGLRIIHRSPKGYYYTTSKPSVYPGKLKEYKRIYLTSKEAADMLWFYIEAENYYEKIKQRSDCYKQR